CNGSPDGDRLSLIFATRSRPACTARSASSSWPLGYPNNARVSSASEWVTAPPHCVITEAQMSWKPRTVLRRSLGSKLAVSPKDPTSLQDTTVTCRPPDAQCGKPTWPGALAGATSSSPDLLSQVARASVCDSGSMPGSDLLSSAFGRA